MFQHPAPEHVLLVTLPEHGRDTGHTFDSHLALVEVVRLDVHFQAQHRRNQALLVVVVRVLYQRVRIDDL